MAVIIGHLEYVTPFCFVALIDPFMIMAKIWLEGFTFDNLKLNRYWYLSELPRY
jgi:hypothetical protein